jgi:urease accessory protein
MMMLSERLAERRPASAQLVLPFELRQKTRFRSVLHTGEEVGVVLERGGVLRSGDCLVATDGTIVEIVAAPEAVTTVRTDDPLQLARAAYHLGNRHVSLQLGPGWLRFPHDHVLADMVEGLGLEPVTEVAPFEPEPGAYGHSGHFHYVQAASHGHGHGQP